MDAVSHRALTIDQFTKQAVPFANVPGHASSLDALTKVSDPAHSDEVLDIVRAARSRPEHSEPILRGSCIRAAVRTQ